MRDYWSFSLGILPIETKCMDFFGAQRRPRSTMGRVPLALHSSATFLNSSVWLMAISLAAAIWRMLVLGGGGSVSFSGIVVSPFYGGFVVYVLHNGRSRCEITSTVKLLPSILYLCVSETPIV